MKKTTGLFSRGLGRWAEVARSGDGVGTSVGSGRSVACWRNGGEDPSGCSGLNRTKLSALVLKPGAQKRRFRGRPPRGQTFLVGGSGATKSLGGLKEAPFCDQNWWSARIFSSCVVMLGSDGEAGTGAGAVNLAAAKRKACEIGHVVTGLPLQAKWARCVSSIPAQQSGPSGLR